jgi:hypothetical protein
MLAILAGCYAPARIAIPDEPKFKPFGVYPFESGICMEAEDVAILQENIGALKTYSDELRRLLTDLRK